MSGSDGEQREHSEPEVQLCLDLPPDVLLQLGAEGGSWTLLRKCEADGRSTYAIDLNQALFDDLDPEGGPYSRHWDSRGLRDALLELSRDCPFTTLVPIRVHPDMVPALRALRAFERALGHEERMAQRWDEALAGGEYRR